MKAFLLTMVVLHFSAQWGTAAHIIQVRGWGDCHAAAQAYHAMRQNVIYYECRGE